jgi:long-subunit fatty acid transport protein
MKSRIGLGTLGLLTGLGAPHLAAQAWGLPASDPVGIARSGAGVAFGQSLEAASLNPALLVTLKDRGSLFLAAGQELQATQTTLQSNQSVNHSADRNRFLGAFGSSLRVGPGLVFGLKFDEPFMRHALMPETGTSRFQGKTIDVTTRRLELQAGWALTPAFSLGASVGMTRIQYAWENNVRIPVPALGASPVSATNPAIGLMEVGLRQEGSKVAPGYTVGFRWALAPRWTIAGTYTSSISATLPLTAGLSPLAPSYFSTTGFGPAIQGTSGQGPVLAAQTKVQPGSGKLTLPGKATLGVRQRVNQLFTWEADLRFIQGSALTLPGYPVLTGPSGPVSGQGQATAFRSGVGMSLAGEMNLGRGWVARLGLSLDTPTEQDTDVEPMVGGARQAAFSGGFGYQLWGGELNLGYQFRQAQDRDSAALDGKWNSTGYSTTGTATRVEGMGHVWSIGYKKAF